MKTSDMNLITLSGSPAHRGRIYGEQYRLKINVLLQHWYESLIDKGSDQSLKRTLTVDTYLQEFLTSTQYLQMINVWAPELLQEIAGIAEGASVSFEHLLCFQLFDEEWIYGLSNGHHRPTEKCTAFALLNSNENNSFAGQNMDIPEWVDGYQSLLRVKGTDGKPDALVFSIVGHIGLNGINSSGVGITCNTLAQLNHSIDGLPVTFIVRSILEKKTLDEAVDFLKAVPHASGQNYILSSDSQIRCFECSGSRVVEYIPSTKPQTLFHTNHALVNVDYVDPPLKFGSRTNSIARLESIQGRLGDGEEASSLNDIQAALSAHDDIANPVSRTSCANGGTIGFTAGSSIYEYGARPRLHLASGPPCQTDYQIFDFDAEPSKCDVGGV